jgi:hypothetical protein
MEWWNLEEPPEWASTTHMFLDKVAGALRRIGPKGIAFLKTQAELEEDSRRKHLALRQLAATKVADEDIVRYLLIAFHNDHLGWKEVALEGFVSINHFPLARDEVERLLDVCAEAMVYLTHASPSETVRLLRRGLQSDDHWIRGKACTEAGFRNIVELRSEVAAFLHDKDDHVARSAQIACEVFEIAAMRGC